MTHDDKIHEVIKLFASMSGRNNILPKSTNPKDTYQWRYAAKFVDTMDEVDVSWSTIKQIIYHIIQHVKKHRALWNKGLWVLTRKDIVDISYQRMSEHESHIKSEIEVIKRNHEFAASHDFAFADKPREDAYPNLIRWYKAGSIGLTYIAVSDSCRKAIEQLDENDNLLPMDQIVQIRVLCFVDPDYKKKLRQVLGNEFLTVG